MSEVRIQDLLDLGRPARPDAAPGVVLPDGEQGPETPAHPAPAAAPGSAPRLVLEVGWGDFTATPGDIHVAGHYQGVMPVAAEGALDRAVSRSSGRPVIAEHTRRRWLGGALGEVTYFPGRGRGTREGSGAGTIERAAVVGLGRVGTFSTSSAVVLYTSLLRELDNLDGVQHAVLVAIGAGAGNLAPDQVGAAMVTGFADALAAIPAHDEPLHRVSVVEIDRLQAERLHRALRRAASGYPAIEVPEAVSVLPGGRFGTDAAAVLALRGLLSRRHGEDDELLRTVLAHVPGELVDRVRDGLDALQQAGDEILDVQLASLVRRAEEPTTDPTRITARSVPGGLVWSAFTARATVPEREVTLNATLVEDLVGRLTAPDEQDARDLPPLLNQWLLPSDLRHLLSGDAPVVLEVDVHTARLPWEFLLPESSDLEIATGEEPLAVRQPLSRQLRTTYARADVHSSLGERPRALVVGDPGSKDARLAGARQEAVAVADVLRAAGFTVDALIGAPDTEQVPGARRATRLDVLSHLLTRRFELVHYCGHGVFDPDKPELSGWLFADGLLTARELVQLRRAPWLVLANACWSAARPETPGTTGLPAATPPPAPAAAGQGHRTAARRQEGALAPVLADEFLRVGVGHFIGASWRVPDQAALRFATTFYRQLLGHEGRAQAAAGQALRAARHALWAEARSGAYQPEVSTAWAAYQHYGDPSDVFPVPAPVDAPPSAGREPALPRRARRDPAPVPPPSTPSRRP
jgi:hypothetical protein